MLGGRKIKNASNDAQSVHGCYKSAYWRTNLDDLKEMFPKNVGQSFCFEKTQLVNLLLIKKENDCVLGQHLIYFSQIEITKQK